ncbi:hypothetical protein NP493_628g00011 [Ridgeia piscesae]|uniref:Uncharacterized protein n=1 Tax=Ridgeia piscesae TaxID=27915 RepID=A0AAD9KTC8_RIDPI|nr:hypothetical protein NP493_628g00011 [Ridgeia piscesae]
MDKRDMSCTTLTGGIAEGLCGILVKEDGPFAECIRRMVSSIFNKSSYGTDCICTCANSYCRSYQSTYADRVAGIKKASHWRHLL